jgi:hypothetical protein
MKKFALIIAVVFGTIVVSNAQELKSKTGVPILPEAGDYAIGIDATPIFDFFGNMIKINSGAAFADPASWDFVDGTNAIYGKYYQDAETALRANLRIGKHSFKDVELVTDVTSTETPPAEVEDIQKISSSAYILGVGMEKHRGKGRLSGFYGAEAQFMLAGYKETYEYGNSLSATNTAHTSTFGQTAGILTDKSGTNWGFGVRGFVGVEYFFAPKVSVGGEFGWGIMYSKEGKGKTEVEAWDFVSGGAKTTETETAGERNFDIDTDNFGGCINLTFHF